MKDKENKFTHKIRRKGLSKTTYKLFPIFGNHLSFIVLVIVLMAIGFFLQNHFWYARWYVFAITSYGLIINDSIQTLGVFITANAYRTKSVVMWCFISMIFFITMWASWMLYDGDISYGRLQKKGFDKEITTISFFQILAPIALLIVTRIGIPVSTTFFLLSAFVTKPEVIEEMVRKSFFSYLLAFFGALVLWSLVLLFTDQKNKKRPPHPYWFALQWLSTGLLWNAWLMQDGSNMGVCLPRSLSLHQFLVLVSFVLVLLMVLFTPLGGNMKRIVNQKTGITDIRAATGVNSFYMLMLFAFTAWEKDKTPISTTWMFIGLLGGRELASGIFLKHKKRSKKQSILKSIYLIVRDLNYILVGLVVSIGLSIVVNPEIRRSYQSFF